MRKRESNSQRNLICKSECSNKDIIEVVTVRKDRARHMWGKKTFLFS